jgi:hypothetical protein
MLIYVMTLVWLGQRRARTGEPGGTRAEEMGYFDAGLASGEEKEMNIAPERSCRFL